MIGKTCVAGLLSLALSSTQQAPASTTTYVANPYIEKIVCLAQTENGIILISGTGFKLDDGRWVSVNHVTENFACGINGKPITVTYADPVGDFSIFTVEDRRNGGLHPDCSGYHDRQWYHAQGFSHGGPVIETIPVMFSSLVADAGAAGRSWAILIYNRVAHGQSGGPVLNGAGEVVGTVNALGVEQPVSFSHQLRDTPICRS